MKKSFKNLWIAILAFSSALCVFTACKGGKKLDAVKDYEWTYNPEFQDECDADMTIDGVLDETRWSDRVWLEHTQNGVSLQYTTLFTAKGLYIAAKAQDSDIQWNSRLNMGYYNSYLGSGVTNADNSTFWFRVSAENEKEYHTFTAYNFFLDAKDRASRNQTRFQGKTALNGELGEADEMTAELFVTWDALNMEIPDGAQFPDAVRICPAYRYVKEENSGENQWILPTFYNLNAYRMLSNGVFTADGYGNPDVENATIGDSAIGLSKSDSWDLSELNAETPSVTSSWAHDQAIFFTNVKSDTYVYGAKVKLLPETWGEGSGGAGLIDMVSPKEFISLYVYANHLNVDEKGNPKAVQIGLYGNLRDLGTPNTRYNDKLYLTLPYEEKYTTEGISLTVIKNGAWVYYFAENRLVYAGMFSMLQGVTAPGLYTLTRQAEFTHFYATDYTGNQEGLTAEINKYAYTVMTEASGGTVTLDKLAIGLNEDGATEDLVFKLEPTSGYVLTSLEVEGTTEDSDYYQYALDTMQDGVVTIDRSKLVGNITIKAKFTTYRTGSTKDATIKVTGTVRSEKDGSNVNGASVALKGDNKLMRYSTTVNNGTYSFYVLRAGTHTVGGKEISTAGKYTFEIEMAGYVYTTGEIILPETQTDNVNFDFVLKQRVIGGKVNIEGVVVESNTEYWTADRYDEDVVTIRSGGNCSHFYYTDVATERAVMEFTVTNLSDVGGSYDRSPSVGVRMENGALARFEVGFTINNTAYYTRTGAWSAIQAYPSTANFDLLDIGVAHTFRIVRDDATVAAYVKQGEDWVELFCVSDPLLSGVRAYGLTYRDGGGEKTIEFSDCKIAYQDTDTVDGVPLDEFIMSALYNELTVVEYDENVGEIEFVSGVREINGKYYTAKNGEIQIAFTPTDMSREYRILVGDEKQGGKGSGTYTFKLNGPCELIVRHATEADLAELLYVARLDHATVNGYHLGKTVTDKADGVKYSNEGKTVTAKSDGDWFYSFVNTVGTEYSYTATVRADETYYKQLGETATTYMPGVGIGTSNADGSKAFTISVKFAYWERTGAVVLNVSTLGWRSNVVLYGSFEDVYATRYSDEENGITNWGDGALNATVQFYKTADELAIFVQGQRMCTMTAEGVRVARGVACSNYQTLTGDAWKARLACFFGKDVESVCGIHGEAMDKTFEFAYDADYTTDFEYPVEENVDEYVARLDHATVNGYHLGGIVTDVADGVEYANGGKTVTAKSDGDWFYSFYNTVGTQYSYTAKLHAEDTYYQKLEECSNVYMPGVAIATSNADGSQAYSISVKFAYWENAGNVILSVATLGWRRDISLQGSFADVYEKRISEDVTNGTAGWGDGELNATVKFVKTAHKLTIFVEGQELCTLTADGIAVADGVTCTDAKLTDETTKERLSCFFGEGVESVCGIQGEAMDNGLAFTYDVEYKTEVESPDEETDFSDGVMIDGSQLWK